MHSQFDEVSFKTSVYTTNKYSTSFSLGIRLLGSSIRKPIYSIYGFVRFADEIVDTFNDQNQKKILEEFKDETYKAIERKFSINPILNSFQIVVHKYDISLELIDTFLESMAMDLKHIKYDQKNYDKYILGSAEVVGLMCLRLFTNSNSEYEKLKPYAMYLGSAFQKVNFLRDLKEDYEDLGRIYFPNVDIDNFSFDKLAIEEDIENDFKMALKGIRLLRPKARLGVYVAYIYYKQLLFKIKGFDSLRIKNERIRIANYQKLILMISSIVRYRLRII